VVVEVIIKGGKKYRGLKKLLEYAEKEPDKELRWSELRNILAGSGLSLTYAEKLIVELEARGIVNKFRKLGETYYKIDVEKLREVVEAVESQ
jgi:DNA-binding IscR family transcriptional regulator